MPRQSDLRAAFHSRRRAPTHLAVDRRCCSRRPWGANARLQRSPQHRAAPVTRLRRDLEVWLFGFAALTQFIWLSFGFYDDRHAVLTLLTLVFANFLILSFAPKRWFQRKTRAEVAAKPAKPE